MNLQHELSVAVDLAKQAGQVALDHYGKVRRLTKRNDEAVSDADRACQRLIVTGLRKEFPTDGIIGEENESGDAITFDVKKPAGRAWVIDPIDGTNNFLAGFGAFAVCIGLLQAGEPVVGVVYDVTRDIVYRAARGMDAWANDRVIEVIKTPMTDSSLIMLTSNLLDAKGKLPAWAARWLSQTSWKVRILGSAAIEAVSVAAGIAHGAVTLNGKLWDLVAPAAIVLEAGGRVTTPKGKPIFPFDLKGYTGAKTPFLMAAPAAFDQFIEDMTG